MPATRRGLPQQDYFPLLALLARRLTDAQAAEVVETLQKGHDRGSTSRDDIRAAIEAVTSAPTGEADVHRAEARLRDRVGGLEPPQIPDGRGSPPGGIRARAAHRHLPHITTHTAGTHIRPHCPSRESPTCASWRRRPPRPMER